MTKLAKTGSALIVSWLALTIWSSFDRLYVPGASRMAACSVGSLLTAATAA